MLTARYRFRVKPKFNKNMTFIIPTSVVDVAHCVQMLLYKINSEKAVVQSVFTLGTCEVASIRVHIAPRAHQTKRIKPRREICSANARVMKARKLLVEAAVSPTFCVRKVTGGWRIVHAFNKSNPATVPAQTPIPRKDVIIDSMSKSTIFSSMDLMDGFYQILMRERNIPYTAVSTPSGML